ncbi:hypothetical protein P280DRAFT_464827 [Massarina eburnea CBS 473.64]|uniref:Uncharacterized protein n=1 Tax=Massarina eburnea CBS 473.64 TaxID=1395130 RepID=A0A6A6SFM9_9PLEO|nr:hypothetical protein P280DRAFT_464827 [Massarina eburnea CBS 473.64]
MTNLDSLRDRDKCKVQRFIFDMNTPWGLSCDNALDGFERGGRMHARDGWAVWVIEIKPGFESQYTPVPSSSETDDGPSSTWTPEEDSPLGVTPHAQHSAPTRPRPYSPYRILGRLFAQAQSPILGLLDLDTAFAPMPQRKTLLLAWVRVNDEEAMAANKAWSERLLRDNEGLLIRKGVRVGLRPR